MGVQTVEKIDAVTDKINFSKILLEDIKALDSMVAKDVFENSPIRIGAEQEFFLINKDCSPSNKAMEVLSAINDPHFTTELGLFNLEVNLDPLELKGQAFQQMHQSLDFFLNKARMAAAKYQNNVLLTGILPTLRSREINLDYMTPMPRYYALNEAMKSIRGGDFILHIDGLDEFQIKHDTVMFEACNTSFQLHLQIPVDDFVSSYNWAQAIAGPVLSVATNSPLLLGKELWQETRIALFQQSIDTRNSSYSLTEQMPRVSFGQKWLEKSVTEIYKDDIARFQIVITGDVKERALEAIKQGNTPKLKALRIHNGTVYRWNRPCYGLSNGKPHLRIENRYIPSGPTTSDEMANFAFWVGLMVGRPMKYDHLNSFMSFKEVKNNFLKAAKNGMDASFSWLGQKWQAVDFVKEYCLPIANKGLQNMGVAKKDIDKYLGIIEERIEKKNGSKWIVHHYRKLQSNQGHNDPLLQLTSDLLKNQSSGLPVAQWNNTNLSESPSKNICKKYVYQIMSRDLYVIQENDFIGMVAAIMKWKNIHHLPVENKNGQLTGLLTWSMLPEIDFEGIQTRRQTVQSFMRKELIITTPDTLIEDAVHTMTQHQIGCLPVVKNGKIIGIITKNDVL